MRSKVSGSFRRATILINTAVCIFPLLVASQAQAQTTRDSLPPSRYLIRAAHLIDGRSDAPRDNVAVLIEGERVVAVGPAAELSGRTGAPLQTIDLGAATILPGLIDNHTHVLLQGDITSADYDEQLLKESIPYRAIRATAAVSSCIENQVVVGARLACHRVLVFSI